ncbi:MAG: hypothetical protein R2780_10620 [Crocinitomicaceae bacterium]|nr:hypothetical protein [Crocinitomicaceae bacterium]
MFRSLYIIGVVGLVLMTSCEKCKRCSYKYTVTTIQQTVNGEVEKTDTLSGILQDESGANFSEECIKKDQEFTIEQYYQNKKDTTLLDNFSFTCVDL